MNGNARIDRLKNNQKTTKIMITANHQPKTNIQTTLVQYIIPRLDMTKKREDVDKGTNRKSPWKPEGSRPPREEDFDEIHEKNQKKKRSVGQ